MDGKSVGLEGEPELYSHYLENEVYSYQLKQVTYILLIFLSYIYIYIND